MYCQICGRILKEGDPNHADFVHEGVPVCSFNCYKIVDGYKQPLEQSPQAELNFLEALDHAA